MSKFATLKKKLIKEGGIAAGVTLLVIAVTMGVTEFSDSSALSLTEAQNALSASNAKVTGLTDQINKSGTSEKRYAGIQILRSQENYDSETEALKELIRYLKEKYRLTSSLKLTLANEKQSDRAEFNGLNYHVNVRDDSEILFGAMSDVHVFSFFEDYIRALPVIVSITKFHMTRNMHMDVSTFSQMTSGGTPEVLTVEMHFLWAGLKPKQRDKNGGPV